MHGCFISNDDSSSMCAVKQPMETQNLKGHIKKWLVDKHGKNVKCTGQLLVEINPITAYLVGPLH